MGRKRDSSPEIAGTIPPEMVDVGETSTNNGKAPRVRKPKVYQLLGKTPDDLDPEILAEAPTIGKLAKMWLTLRMFVPKHYQQVWVHRCYILDTFQLDMINARPPRGPRPGRPVTHAE